MFLQEQKQLKEKSEIYLTSFVNNLSIPNPPTDNNFCIELHNVLQSSKKDYNSIKINEGFDKLFQNSVLSTNIQKGKSRLCGGLLKRGDKAYKCFDCMTEENSIQCTQCFELDKHEGHQFERIMVYGGCCDCGDVEKWNPKGFCSAHQDQQDKQIKIDQTLLTRFKIEQNYTLKVLYSFYNHSYSRFQIEMQKMEDIKLKAEINKRILVFIDNYGNVFIDHLIIFNKKGRLSNEITSCWLDQVLKIGLEGQNCLISSKKDVFTILFDMQNLPTTSDKIVDLFILMFELKGFRERATIKYMNLYNNSTSFLVSNYSNLGSQLFTSHITISKLVREKKIMPLQNKNKQVTEKNLENVAFSYQKFYNDIKYLSKLHGQASVQYFKYHAEQKKMVDLASYRLLFNKILSSKDYYGLQNIFVSKCVDVIKVMQKDEQQYIYKLTMRQLYQFIANYPTSNDNIYRSQERFFTLIVFSYIHGDLTKFDDVVFMKQFLSMLGVANLKTEISHILQGICKIFGFTAQLFENTELITENYTYYAYYLKRTTPLFSLDSILLKILLKICKYYNENYQQKIDYEQIIKNGDKSNNILQKLKRYEFHHVNEGQIIDQQEQGQVLNEFDFKYFINYISLISEASCSDLPELSIMCYLQSFNQSSCPYFKMPYQKLAMFYYQNILQSCQHSKVAIKDFKIICELFFKQQQVFKQFVNLHLDQTDNKRLVREDKKSHTINGFYFKSKICKELENWLKGSLSFVPYYRKPEVLKFLSQQASFYAKKAVQLIIFLQKQSKFQSQQGISKIEGYYRSLLRELWGLFILSNNIEIYNYINQLTSNPKIGTLKQVQILTKEIAHYMKVTYDKQHNTDHPNEQMSEQNRRKQQLKRQKLANKKNLLKQKINKNQQLFINTEIQQQETAEEQICCLCREDKFGQIIYYIGFIHFTNFHRWMNLDTKNILFSLTTCGHKVHSDCYKKILAKNQVYNFCPLCKNPMNIIVPKKSISQEFDDQAHYFKNQFQSIKIHPELITKWSFGPQLFVSLAVMAVKGLIFPSYFKKQLQIYRLILQILKYYNLKIELLDQSCYFNQLNYDSPNPSIQKIFKYFQHHLFDYISGQSRESSQEVSSIFKQQAGKILSDLFNTAQQRSHQSMIIQYEQLLVLKKTMHRPLVQDNLASLSNRYLGKCPNCNLITNQQAICLICPNFKTCLGCEKQSLMKHASTYHLSTCLFLKTYSGQIVSIYRNRQWKFDSIYEDYAGRNFQPQRTQMNNQKGGFKLVHKKLMQYYADIESNNIQSRLRYKQKQNNKVYHNEPI